MQDRQHPFYRPLWVRIVILLVCLGWTGFEWRNGEAGWLVIALAVTAYAVWAFFIAYDPDSEGPKNPESR